MRGVYCIPFIPGIDGVVMIVVRGVSGKTSMTGVAVPTPFVVRVGGVKTSMTGVGVSSTSIAVVGRTGPVVVGAKDAILKLEASQHKDTEPHEIYGRE